MNGLKKNSSNLRLLYIGRKKMTKFFENWTKERLFNF